MLEHGWLGGDHSYYFIDMEYCPETLEDRIKKAGAGILNDPTINNTAISNFAHPENAAPETAVAEHVPLSPFSDFGSASKATSKRLNTTYKARGTESYRAPEVLENNRFNNPADIFALGCIIYEILTGRKPFPATDVF